MNRTGLATAVLAGAVVFGAVTGTGLHALGWELRPESGIVNVADEPAEPAQSADARTPSSAPRTSPAATQVPTKPVPSAKVAPTALSSLHLLDADEVGPLNDRWHWTTESTAPGDGQDAAAFCQTSALSGLGAVKVTRRDFLDKADRSSASYAGQTLATFDNPAAAATAYKTMAGWRSTCAATMRSRGYMTALIGDFQRVRTNAEKAGWWLGTFTPVQPDEPQGNADEGWFGATGIALDGNKVTLIWINVVGQDYNYDAGKEPMVTTLVNASSVVATG